ncbi:MAG: bacteriohemerythrin [Rhodospirillales bacterium]
MTIIWRDEMSVGDERIDGDHKRLINLVNGFEWATVGEVNFALLKKILSDLENYTVVHFEREEEIQDTIDYPYRDAHKAAHRSLIHELHKVQEHVTAAAAKEGEEGTKVAQEMAVFLKHWIVDHVIEEDLRMKPFILKHKGQ